MIKGTTAHPGYFEIVYYRYVIHDGFQLLIRVVDSEKI